MPPKKVCKECTYVQRDINEIYEDFYSPTDNEPTFSASYYHEVPIGNMGNIQ